MWSDEPGKEEMARHMERAGLVMALYKEIGLDAMAVGSSDLMLGHSQILKLARKNGITVLSGNLRNKAGKELFPGSILLEKNGEKIGVLAITMPESRLESKFAASGVVFSDPVAAAKELTGSLRAKGADVIVLLSAADRKQTTEIINQTPEINIALVSGRGGWMPETQKLGESFIVGVPPGGRSVGLIEISRKGDGFDLVDVSERYSLMEQIRRTMASISRLENMMSRAGVDETRIERSRQRMESMQKNILQLIDRFRESVTESPDVGYFSHKRVNLDNSVKDDPEWSRRVAESKKKYDLDNRKHAVHRRLPPDHFRRKGRRGIPSGRQLRDIKPVPTKRISSRPAEHRKSRERRKSKSCE